MPLPFLIGILGAAGSAITTVAAGATAVGGTIAAGAAAVGGTVAAGAATVGSAVASTAVGSAAIGAMTTVGTAVGTAATAATALPGIGIVAEGIAAVATGTGATAVGTITTTGAVGIASAASGAKKMSEASEIKSAAMSRYNRKKAEVEKIQEKTNGELKKLGEEKLGVWNSLNRFVVLWSQIQNPPELEGEAKSETFHLTSDDLDNVRAVAISAKDLLSGGVASIGAGSLIGLATSGGVVSTITVASTGTVISSLSGAAATNATLAALGGGAIKAGGAGIAGGSAVLGGLTIAPMLMVGGFMFNSAAKKALEAAEDVEYEVDVAVGKLNKISGELDKVRGLSEKILAALKDMNGVYQTLIDEMEGIVSRKKDYASFTQMEKRALEKTVLTVKLLKVLTTQNILDGQNNETVLTEEVTNTLQAVNERRQTALSGVATA